MGLENNYMDVLGSCSLLFLSTKKMLRWLKWVGEDRSLRGKEEEDKFSQERGIRG